MANRVGRQEVRSTDLGMVLVPCILIFESASPRGVSLFDSGLGSPVATVDKPGTGLFTITFAEHYAKFWNMAWSVYTTGLSAGGFVAVCADYVPLTGKIGLCTLDSADDPIDPPNGFRVHLSFFMSSSTY